MFRCHPQTESQQHQRNDRLDQHAEVEYIADEPAEDDRDCEPDSVPDHAYSRKRRIAAPLHSQQVQCCQKKFSHSGRFRPQ